MKAKIIHYNIVRYMDDEKACQKIPSDNHIRIIYQNDGHTRGNPSIDINLQEDGTIDVRSLDGYIVVIPRSGNCIRIKSKR